MQERTTTAAGEPANAAADGSADPAKVGEKPADGPPAMDTATPAEKSAKDGKRDDRDAPLSSPRERRRSRSRDRDRRRSSPAR